MSVPNGVHFTRDVAFFRLDYLVFLVADVLLFGLVEREVADGSHQAVDAERDHRQEDIAARSAGEAVGFQAAVVDDDATDPAQKERQ